MEFDTEPYRRRLKTLQTEFDYWRPHYREIQEYFAPRKGRHLVSDTEQDNDGRKRHSNIINSTGCRAIEIAANGFQGGISRESSDWFELTVANPKLGQYEPVKQYLAEVARIIRKVFSESNFYSSAKHCYHEVLTFGTACTQMEQDDERVLHMYPYTAGEFYAGQNHRQDIDTIYRRFSMAVWHAAQAFGIDNCSPTVQRAWRNKEVDKRLTVVHAVQPRQVFDPSKADASNMPWESVYFEEGAQPKYALRVSGYRQQPFGCFRWFQKGTDVYGWGPGMEYLGDQKQLQKMEQKKLRGIDKNVDPPMNASTSLRDADLTPNGINFHDPLAANQWMQPVHQPNPYVKEISAEIHEVIERLRAGFYNDIFLMISASGSPQKTAYQVAKEHGEQLMLLGPVVGQAQRFLNVLIQRAYSLCMEAGYLPPTPPELLGQPYTIRYEGILAQAQRMVDTNAMVQWLGTVGEVATLQAGAGMPVDVLDNVDTDKFVESFAERLGVPPDLVRQARKVARIRRSRAEQMAQEAQRVEAAELANAAKTMSETQVGERSFLEEAMTLRR